MEQKNITNMNELLMSQKWLDHPHYLNIIVYFFLFSIEEMNNEKKFSIIWNRCTWRHWFNKTNFIYFHKEQGKTRTTISPHHTTCSLLVHSISSMYLVIIIDFFFFPTHFFSPKYGTISCVLHTTTKKNNNIKFQFSSVFLNWFDSIYYCTCRQIDRR